MRIHILGASGSGTSTLGAALAHAAGARHLDTDDYYWSPTDPPFQAARERPERQALLDRDTPADGAWVLSGSLCSWGDFLISRFEHVVFLTVPTRVRLERLRARERTRFGEAALAPGGAMHENHAAFLGWAADYDAGDASMRSRAAHEEWLATLPCPVLRLSGERTPSELCRSVVEHAGIEAVR